MYGEPRKPDGRTPPGSSTTMRLHDLALTRLRQIFLDPRWPTC